jgi:hypothetical protein
MFRGWTTTWITYSWWGLRCIGKIEQLPPVKTRGGGLCIFVNNSWCTQSNIKEVSRSCSPEVEHLTISCRPPYLPREFAYILFVAVYLPPPINAGTKTALNELYKDISKNENTYTGVALLVAGDFNAGKPKSVLPNFYQHVKCATGETLDHLYSTHRDGYKALPHPPFGKSDHNSIPLIPAYESREHQWLSQ